MTVTRDGRTLVRVRAERAARARWVPSQRRHQAARPLRPGSSDRWKSRFLPANSGRTESARTALLMFRAAGKSSSRGGADGTVCAGTWKRRPKSAGSRDIRPGRRRRRFTRRRQPPHPAARTRPFASGRSQPARRFAVLWAIKVGCTVSLSRPTVSSHSRPARAGAGRPGMIIVLVGRGNRSRDPPLPRARRCHSQRGVRLDGRRALVGELRQDRAALGRGKRARAAQFPHTSRVYAAAFSPDGRHFVSCCGGRFAQGMARSSTR